MAITVNMQGPFVSAHAKPTNTSATTLVTAGAERALVYGFWIANEGGGARTVQIDFYDSSATATRPLWINQAIDANAEAELTLPGPLLLDEDDEIRVTVDSGNTVDFYAFYALGVQL
jgi:hypothetical protein